MFSRISFKSQPDQFQLVLGFSHAGRLSVGDGPRRKVSVEWTSADSDALVLERISAAITDPGLVEERVRVLLAPAQDAATSYGVVAASAFHKEVQLALKIHSTKPTLDAVELLRTSGSGAMPAGLAQAIWSALELSYMRRVRCTAGVAELLEQDVLVRLTSLRLLNLSHCDLASLPGIVGLLQGLEELRVVGNRLKMLPPELGLLRNLRILAADSNELILLPGELRHCSQLEELTLENNRLTSVLLNFRALPHLQVLHLFNNPLEFLPEISPCDSLRHLSVANMRVTADQGYSKFNVELLPASALSGGGGMGISLFDSGKKEDKLRPIFALMLRRSSGHHPLLAGALRQVAEQDPKNRELMARQENALQQLVLMALNDNPIVVEQTCATLRLLARHSPALAEAIVENDVSSVMMLLTASEERLQLASLQVLAAVAFESQVAAVNILTDKVLWLLEGLVLGGEGDGGPDTTVPSPKLRAAALEAVGNLAFAPKNRTRLQGRQALMQCVLTLAQQGALPQATGAQHVTAAAVRVLAVLGENDAVWRAVRRRPLISERGVRILSMDGGGMKGMATVQLLRELEARAGRRIQDMFDIICGTSTGGLLAVALGLRNLTLDDCEHIYKVLGQKVFSRPQAKQSKEETWMESFYRTFHSKTQHVRAVVVGYKHDAAVYETLLKDYCDFSKEPRCLADSMIDTACLDVPKVALVSTLASVTPAFPFVFRNYELPPSREALARQIHAHSGSSKHRVWEAVRASSAAAYYLDDFSCAGDKFQDGAVVANNPAIIALQEARLLWPDAPIDVVVSLGSGSTPSCRRSAAVSSFVETGSILIESACGVERPAEALATLLPLVPKVQYFRFSPMDPRCGMELDEIDPAKWAQLEAATQDYILGVAHKFDDAAAALTEGLEEEVLVPPTPRDTLSNLRLGPRRQLTLVSSPSPAPCTPATPGQAVTAMFTTVVDVQHKESRGRLPRTPSTLRQPTPAPAAAAAAPSSSAAAYLRQGGAMSSGSEDGLGGAGVGPGPGQDLAASFTAAAAAAAVVAEPPNTAAGPSALAAAAGGGPGAAADAASDAQQGSAEEQQQGGGLSSIFSWFSPRKPVTSLASADGPEPSAASAPAILQMPHAAAVGPPQQAAMLRAPADPGTHMAQGHNSSASGDGTAKQGDGDGRPASAVPEQQQAFMTFSFNKQPRESPARKPPESGLAMGGAGGDADAGLSSSSSPGGLGLAEALDRATTATGAEHGPASPALSKSQSREALAAMEQGGPAAETAAAAAAADPAGFLAHELGGLFDEDAVEVGACHLALAPAGDGLVLSWRESVEAILEPSDSSRALLAHLGLDATATNLAELFERQPSIHLPLLSGSGGSSSGGLGSSCQGQGGALGLLSRQVQWVAGRQLSVLLLQSTLPDVLLTHDMLEGELRGVLAQQVAVCEAPLPTRLLLALLGGGGAVAVVCPRGPRASGSAGLGDEIASPSAGLSTPVLASSSSAAADEDAASTFFVAFYAALKGAATLTGALAVAESAQPGLAGVYGVHGMRDGALVVLPGA